MSDKRLWSKHGGENETFERIQQQSYISERNSPPTSADRGEPHGLGASKRRGNAKTTQNRYLVNNAKSSNKQEWFLFICMQFGTLGQNLVTCDKYRKLREKPIDYELRGSSTPSQALVSSASGDQDYKLQFIIQSYILLSTFALNSHPTSVVWPHSNGGPNICHV